MAQVAKRGSHSKQILEVCFVFNGCAEGRDRLDAALFVVFGQELNRVVEKTGDGSLSGVLDRVVEIGRNRIQDNLASF